MTDSTIARKDPATLTPEERRAEAARILAAGYVRILKKALAASAPVEAPCDHAVSARENVA